MYREGVPLSALLHLYDKSIYECYINNMEGAKALATFMGPVSFPEVPKDFTYSSLLVSYEICQLIKVLVDLKELQNKRRFSSTERLEREKEYERAILYILIEKRR